MRYLILVAGMHRSGTSALTGVLTLFGVSGPKTLMPANESNPKGFFESAPFAGLHDEILSSAKSNWRDCNALPDSWRFSDDARVFRARTAHLLREEFNDSAIIALKDPRICRFLPFWLDVAREMRLSPRVIIPIRHPAEVAASLAARDQISLSEALLLWLRHVIDAERDSRGLLRSFVLLDDLLKDWRTTLKRVSQQLQITWGCPRDETVDDFLSLHLKHHNWTQEREIGHWAFATFNALCQMRADPQSFPAAAALDQVAEHLAAAWELFGPLLALPGPTQSAGDIAGPLPETAKLLNDRSSALRRRLSELHANVASPNTARYGETTGGIVKD